MFIGFGFIFLLISKSNSTMNDNTRPEDWIQYHDHIERPAQIAKEEKLRQEKRIQETRAKDEAEQIQRERELAFRFKQIQHQNQLAMDRPAEKIFQHICNQVETNPLMHESLRAHIEKTRELTIKLLESDWNTGISTFHRVGIDFQSKLFDLYRSDDIVEDFMNHSKQLYHPITTGPFNGWSICVRKRWTWAYVFIIVVPYRKVAVELVPPWGLWFRSFF
jgi:hypothetical protein